MCSRVEEVVEALGKLVAAIDPSCLGADDAASMVSLYAEAERLAGAARTIAAGRVAELRAWHGSGYRSAAEWMTARTGATLHASIASLHTAASLASLPATREAFVAGRLSEVQAAEVTGGASIDPSFEEELLCLALSEPISALRERARMVRFSAAGDESATERIRRSRYFKHWTERDGALRMDIRVAPDDGAGLLGAVLYRAEELWREAKRSGQHETLEAHAADAVCSLVETAALNTIVHVHVDQAAWERGSLHAGETCEIPGVGPTTVSAAKRLGARGRVKTVVRNGVDVTMISHEKRLIPAHLRSAVEARDKTCVAPGCTRRRNLEIDHIDPVERGGKTKLSNLARLCRWHHALKTHRGWTLSGSPGAWTFSTLMERSRDPEKRPGARSPPRRRD